MSVTLAMNLQNTGTSQYTNYDFESFLAFDDAIIGANENGLFVLAGDDDAGYGISATISLPPNNFATSYKKHIRAVNVSYASTGDILFTFTFDEDKGFKAVLSGTNGSYSGKRLNGNRDLQGQNIGLRIENSRGEMFNLSTIAYVLIFGQGL